MLVSGSKYEAFHISGQIMRRGNTFEFDKVTIIIFFVAKHSLFLKISMKFRKRILILVALKIYTL